MAFEARCRMTKGEGIETTKPIEIIQRLKKVLVEVKAGNTFEDSLS